MMNHSITASLKKVSAKDFAYDQLKQRIIEGKLQPDQAIIEEEISSKLGISRTPLREALLRLEIENLLARQTNGRLKVAPISVQEAREIFTVRSQLEGMAVAEAVEKATKADIENLSDIAAKINTAYREGNIEEIVYYGEKFHHYIYVLSGNNTVKNILSQLNDHIHRYRRLVPQQSVGRMKEPKEEHQQILDFIAKKDAAGAKRTMQRHIEDSLETAVAAIETYLKNNDESVW